MGPQYPQFQVEPGMEPFAGACLSCSTLAKHFADQIAEIHFDVDSRLRPGSVAVPVAFACPAVMDGFQLIQTDDVDKRLEVCG